MSPAYRSLNLVLLGPPASGKGTQARVLSSRYEIPHIATGEMLRNEVEKGTRLGEQAAECMQQGELVPDELIRGLILQRLVREDCARGFLLDGYPRSVEQAGILDDLLAELGRAIERVVVVRVSDEEILQRARSREARRLDEEETVLRKRLSLYRQGAEALEQLYQRRGLLFTVDGMLPQEQVTESVLQAVGMSVGA